MTRFVSTQTRNPDGSVTTVTSRKDFSGWYLIAVVFMLISLGFLAISFATANAIKIPCKLGTENCVPAQ